MESKSCPSREPMQLEPSLRPPPSLLAVPPSELLVASERRVDTESDGNRSRLLVQRQVSRDEGSIDLDRGEEGRCKE